MNNPNNDKFNHGEIKTSNSELNRALLLPMLNVSNIMKIALPPDAKISKESKELMQECATEFIGFITSEAADRCLGDSRKFLSGEDIATSLNDLGFENYGLAIAAYLNAYQRSIPSKKRAIEDISKNDFLDDTVPSKLDEKLCA